MSDQALTVLVIGGDEPLHAALHVAGLQASAAEKLPSAGAQDAVLIVAATSAALADLCRDDGLVQAAFDSAVVVLTVQQDLDVEQALLGAGVEAIADMADLPALPRVLRHAVQRKRTERSARNAHATDLATGLPHQAQLLEHMTQLLALREREPAPMVLLVLRIDGPAHAASRLGTEAGNILRRKAAVRLRGGLRASDVVAAIGPDTFGILLGHVEAKADGERVAAKLVRALQQPLLVSGQPFSVSTAVGLALYPEHGKDAASLLQRASAQAGSVATLGSSQGSGNVLGRGLGAAANDDAQ